MPLTDLAHLPTTWRQLVPAWLEAIANNPVRIYAIVSAALALVVYFVPALPMALVLALVAAILGVGGEATRALVTPTRKLDGPDDPDA